MKIEEINAKIEEFFERNYEMLRAEGNRPLTADLRKKALTQVKVYYEKMRDVAHKVTETEVKLTLPEQPTPAGRRFAIEGIVDIVREDDEVWMYDIKTHDPEMIRDNQALYAEQLNVYAHIYQRLRGNQLDQTAIISTGYPRRLDQALKEGNPGRIAREYSAWDPVIPIPFEQEQVEKMIANFGAVVDQIEDKKFTPPPLENLERAFGNGKAKFANKICRFCDARYSCGSYRNFARQQHGRGFDFRRFFAEDLDPVEQEDWVNGNLES